MIAILAAAQTSLAPNLEIGTARPQLLLCWVVAWAIIRGRGQALPWALVGGLLLDLFSQLPLGSHVLALSAVAFLTDMGGRALHGGTVLYASLGAALMTVVYGTVLLLANAAGGGHPQIGHALSVWVLPAAAFDLIAMVPLYYLLRGVDRRFPQPIMPQW